MSATTTPANDTTPARLTLTERAAVIRAALKAQGLSARDVSVTSSASGSSVSVGESPLNKAEAHRLAHKLRDPKFYTARTKRAVNSGGVR